MYGIARNAVATATGQVDAGEGYLLSVGLCAGSDAATAIVRTGGAGGTIVAKLGCAANTSTDRTFVCGKPYADLHVTVTGTSPTVEFELG